MNESQKELMTVDEFLSIYSIGRTAYFNLVKKKLLRITNLGRRTYIKRTDAEIWLKTLGTVD